MHTKLYMKIYANKFDIIQNKNILRKHGLTNKKKNLGNLDCPVSYKEAVSVSK